MICIICIRVFRTMMRDVVSGLTTLVLYMYVCVCVCVCVRVCVCACVYVRERARARIHRAMMRIVRSVATILSYIPYTI